MATPLSAHEQPISKIFGGDYVFDIPGFQRPYAWTTEQARDLLDDLLGFMTSDSGAGEEVSPYFLGSIVLIKPDNSTQCDVVDGQQRLTTITLLLSGIRANLPPEKGGDITQLIYEKGSQILGTQDRFRLSLRSRDLEFFQTYVQREGGFAKLVGLSELLSHIRMIYRKANLTLLTRKKNASASNWDFDRKKTSYFTKDGVSPFVLTTQVIQHAEWTPAVVDARQKQLSDKLESHWRLQDRKAA